MLEINKIRKNVSITTLHYATKVILTGRFYEVGVMKAMGADNGFIGLLFIEFRY